MTQGFYDAELQDFVCGGYYITRYALRDDWPPHASLPVEFVTLSQCLASFIPDTWCISWAGDFDKDLGEEGRLFGMAEPQFRGMADWITERLDDVTFGFPNVCFRLESARALVNKFLPPDEKRLLVGLGLHQDFVQAFLEATEPKPSPPGYAATVPSADCIAISHREKLIEGGCLIGYDVLNRDVMTCRNGCSWLCNGLNEDMARVFEIHANEHGLLASYGDALRCAEYAFRIQAEPGLWVPWAVIAYSER